MRAALALAGLLAALAGSAAHADAAADAKTTMNSAMDFVSAIYRKLPDYDETNIPYAPKLAALIARDNAYKTAAGDAGAIDWDPLCGCQDLGDQYRLTKLTAHASTAGTIAVDARIWVGSALVVTLDLVRAGASWQIADIHTPKVSSLLADLESEVPKEEADLRAHPPAK